MKFYLKFFLLYSLAILISKQASADAWVQEKGQTYQVEGFYYTFPTKAYNSLFFPSVSFPGTKDAKVLIEKKSNRQASTIEMQYGATNIDTMQMKLDYGYVQDHYVVDIAQPNTRERFEFNLGYSSLIPEVTWRRQLGRDAHNVLSAHVTYFPGEYIISAHHDFLATKQGSMAAKLLHGITFEDDINLFNILGGAGKKRYHYFEWQMGLRHFYRLDQTQWDFNQSVGIRPADKWLLVFGLYNTLHGVTYNKKPFSQVRMASLINNTYLDSTQEDALMAALKDTLEEHSTYRDHKINYKISYQFTPDKSIAIEGFSNVFIRKPFEDNTVVLTYTKTF